LLLLLPSCGSLAHPAQAAHLCQPLLLMVSVPPQNGSHHWMCQQLLQAMQVNRCAAVLLALLHLAELLPESTQLVWVSGKLKQLVC
jgi:hypothetical protein